jgi:hypothetical protein
MEEDVMFGMIAPPVQTINLLPGPPPSPVPVDGVSLALDYLNYFDKG